MTAEANQELFIFQKGEDGAWRIPATAFRRSTRRPRD
jgi:hypothetical protein